MDLVYNHAGGGFDPQSLHFFDRRQFVSNNDSLYFTNDGWAGGLGFDAALSDRLRDAIRDAVRQASPPSADGARDPGALHGGRRSARTRTGATIRGSRPGPSSGGRGSRPTAPCATLMRSPASFRDTTHRGYQLGFPLPGLWREVFNSDFYDRLPNPQVAGNGGEVTAAGPPLHGFQQSASVTIPANSVLVFARA